MNLTVDAAQIRIADVLNCDTYTKRGKEALKRLKDFDSNIELSVEMFFNEIYAEPFFISNNGAADDEPEDDADTSGEELPDDFAFSSQGMQLRELRRAKESFEDHFVKKANALSFIRGSSGTGKSTYLNWLIRNKANFSSIIDCNLEESQTSIIRGSMQFPPEKTRLPSKNGTIPSAPWLFLIKLLDKAYDIAWELLNLNDMTILNGIQDKFADIYGLDYPDKVRDFFSVLKYRSDYIGRIEEQNSEVQREARTALFKAFLEFIDVDDVIRSIRNILELATRTVLLKSRLKPEEQMLFVFDSIEHYIDVGKKIYDNDIRVIVDAVFAFVQDEETVYSRHGLHFADFFKFILVVRDTTDKMFSSTVHGYFSVHVQNSIDISNWYRTEDIYEKKLRFFKAHLPMECPVIKLFELIISDKAKPNSIMNLLSVMYNHNKRRITEILAIISDTFADLMQQPEHGSILSVSEFEDYWINKTRIKYRYMCRRAILRMIWNEIEKTKYFEAIRVQPKESSFNDSNTYARRILTWLSNHTLLGEDKYFSFYELVNGVLHCNDIQDQGGIPESGIRKLASVLFALNESRFMPTPSGGTQLESSELNPNKWCQLVVIKYNDELLRDNLSEGILTEKILKDYTEKTKHTEEYGVKITDAGRFFIYMQNDFEYYACRYLEANAPLIFLKDYNKIALTLEIVYKNAKNCINAVILNEYIFYNGNTKASFGRGYHYQTQKRENSESAEIPFPLRVIRNHRNYLLHYRRILEDFESNKQPYLSKGDNVKLKEMVNQYIEKYEKLFYALKGGNYEISTGRNRQPIHIDHYLDGNAGL